MLITSIGLAPSERTDRPPIILIHGAANSAGVWTFWQRELALRGWPSFAVNLRGHGNSEPMDLSGTRMEDYAQDVYTVAGQLRQPPVLIGWSLGGLVAMMVASEGHSLACVCLAPSTPAQQVDSSVELRTGDFGAEEYGISNTDPENQPSMPDLDVEARTIALASQGRESRLARDERRRGIVIESIPCPLMIVTGTNDTAWPSQRYEGLWLKADRLSVEASHWGLVLNKTAIQQAIPAVLRWIEDSLA